jgi:hypothetical protein
MFLSLDPPNLDRISERAMTVGTTLEDFLHDPDLLPSLKYETDAVISFLSRIDNIRTLLQYSLTTAFSSAPNYANLLRLSTAALCSDSAYFAREVVDSDLLPEFLTAFWTTPAVSSLPCCANLQRIVCKYARFPSAALFESAPQLLGALFSRLDVVAFRHLAFLLLSELRERIPNFGAAVSLLSSAIAAGGDAGHGGLLVLRELLLADTRPLRAGCDFLALGRALLVALARPQTALQRADGFSLLVLLQELCQTVDFDPLLAEFEPRLAFDGGGAVCAAMVRSFPVKFVSAFDRFMGNPADSFLGQAVTATFEEMVESDQAHVARAADMAARVSAALTEGRTAAGHLLALAAELNRVPAVRADPAWAEFAAGFLDERLAFARECAAYGGAVPGGRRAAAAPPAALGMEEQAGGGGAFEFSDSSSEEEEDDADIIFVGFPGAGEQPEEDDAADGGAPPQAEEEAAEEEDGADDRLIARFLGGGAPAQAAAPAEQAEGEEDEEEETEADRQRYELMRRLMGDG